MPNKDPKAAKLDEVRKTLTEMTHLHDCYVKWDGTSKERMKLYGTFNQEQLEALAWWMKERGGPEGEG